MPGERVPNARERMWAAIRALAPQPFTRAQVAERAGVPSRTADCYMQQLRRAGYLTQAGRAERPRRRVGEARRNWWRAMRYVLARDTGVEAPRLRRDGSPAQLGRGREQLWRAARILREFDARELALAASTPERPVAAYTARDFCQGLTRAGYCVVCAPGAPGRHARYRLVPAMASGPRPPIERKSGEIVDPNTGRVMWPR